MVSDNWPCDHQDGRTTATLELVRLQLNTGHTRKARRAAGDLVGAYQAVGLPDHPRCLDAACLQAEAQLRVDWGELPGDRKAHWAQSGQRLRELYDNYERTFGPRSALTLTARVQRDHSLVSLGQPRAALPALRETESLLTQEVGADHPMTYQVRFDLSQCYGQLRDWSRCAEQLEILLPRQVATLGADHADTLETMLALGIAVALAGDVPRGGALVSRARPQLIRKKGWNSDSGIQALTADILFRLPGTTVILTLIKLFERLWPHKPPGKVLAGPVGCQNYVCSL